MIDTPTSLELTIHRHNAKIDFPCDGDDGQHAFTSARVGRFIVWQCMGCGYLTTYSECEHVGLFADSGPLDKTHKCPTCGADVPNREL